MPDFDHTSTTEDVLAGVDLTGRRILVAGVSSGLGAETARVLIGHGAEVIGTARDVGRAEQAVPGCTAVALDLAARERPPLRRRPGAGGQDAGRHHRQCRHMACPFGRTADGFDLQFGTNHLGHFMLVDRLAAIRPGSSMVRVSLNDRTCS